MGREDSAPPSSEEVRGGGIGGCGWEQESLLFPSPTLKKARVGS